MMLLEPGANSIILTLNDSITLSNPEYVLVIVEDFRNKKVACKLGTDLSDYPDRFNKFTLTVKASPVAANAEIELKDLSGKYYVYEMADADTFNFAGVNTLDLETLDGLIEQGKVRYITPVTDPEHYADTRPSSESYGD